MSFCEQTGWERVHPLQICQVASVLESVSTFTYDLNDQAFLKYFLCRCGIDFATNLSPEKRFFLSGSWKEVLTWFMASPEFKYEVSGLQVNTEDRQFFARMWKIMRGQLQDCWDIYQQSVTFEEQAA